MFSFNHLSSSSFRCHRMKVKKEKQLPSETLWVVVMPCSLSLNWLWPAWQNLAWRTESLFPLLPPYISMGSLWTLIWTSWVSCLGEMEWLGCGLPWPPKAIASSSGWKNPAKVKSLRWKHPLTTLEANTNNVNYLLFPHTVRKCCLPFVPQQ